MSRLKGPQRRGAARQVRIEKRQQAEVRQAAEREWMAKHRAEQAGWQDAEPLTWNDLDGLIRAVAVVKLEEVLDRLGYQPRNLPKEGS